MEMINQRWNHGRIVSQHEGHLASYLALHEPIFGPFCARRVEDFFDRLLQQDGQHRLGNVAGRTSLQSFDRNFLAATSGHHNHRNGRVTGRHRRH
jgi:hypothetical protein